MSRTLHTHLAETLDEERGRLERFGKRPMAVLDDLGWIADDVWVAHVNDAEVGRLVATRTGIAHCPSSNCRLRSGIARTVDLIAAGAPVGLGADDVASNEVAALLPELRMSLFLARQRSIDPTVFLPLDTLRVATTGGARCLVLGPERVARHVLVGGENVVRDGSLVGADVRGLHRQLIRRGRRLCPDGAIR